MTGRLGFRKPGLAPTETPNSHDFMWAAGIFEGEGSSYFIGGHTERAEVPQKDPWLLLKLQALFGGSVYPYRGGNVPRRVITGSRARGFLMSIYEILSPRRQEQVDRTMRWKEKANAV